MPRLDLVRQLVARMYVLALCKRNNVKLKDLQPHTGLVDRVNFVALNQIDKIEAIKNTALDRGLIQCMNERCALTERGVIIARETIERLHYNPNTLLLSAPKAR